MKELLIGGARSGKSRIAQQRAIESRLSVAVIATATAGDNEMAQRIQAHKVSRPADWKLVEAPVLLARALTEHAAADTCIIVDCLTLWLSNLLTGQSASDVVTPAQQAIFSTERQALIDVIPALPGSIVFVSNETGQGIVPIGALTRRYVDEAGRLNQDIASLSDRVTLVVAGIEQTIKQDH